MKYTIFDNNGETLDRYTIIEMKTGDMLALSESGAGVDMFSGNCVDDVMFHTYGYNWRKRLPVKKVIKRQLPIIISNFKKEGNIGVEILFDSLPIELQKHIDNRFNDKYYEN